MINIDVGSSDSGMGAIFSSGVNSGKIRVRLVKPKFRDRDINQIIDDVRDALRDVPGIQYQVTGRGGPGGGGGGDIDIEIYNDDIQETRKVTNRIRRMALARPDIAEVKLSVDEQKPQIQVDFDREKMSELGLNTSVVGNLLMIFFRGVEASRYLDSGDEYDIVVRYDRAFRNSIKEIENMPIQTNAGDIVPLSTIARVYENLAPTAIERKNQERYQKVSLTLKNSYTDASGKTVDKDLNKTINEISAMLDEIRAEDKERGFDWYYQLSGTAENFQDSMKALVFALIISIFLVYMVMASQFESYREPFIVLLTVPLGLIGVAAIFILTGRAMDMSALIGIIMLVGIVVNNGIVMVDAANQNRARGMDLETAIVNAARTRMRPVMMTTLTTVLSMIPLALQIGEGSETWSGMGTTVVGGLSAATLLTLFFVPIMYTFFASKKFEMPEYEEELDVISRKKDDAPEVATDNA
jgi:HAE1 family hydrophobic/amphiphilic exporter-1